MVNLDQIRVHQTNGINCDITTEDIIKKLTSWDNHYGIEISDVGDDCLTVKFAQLPEDLTTLAADIYDFCPDVIDQGYGCMDDMLAMMAEDGLEPDVAMRALMAGVDFTDEDFGVKILQNALRLDQIVVLWWD